MTLRSLSILATLLAAGCAGTIPGISYPDKPAWDCAIVAFAVTGDQINAVQTDATHCQVVLESALAPSLIGGVCSVEAVVSVFDKGGIITCPAGIHVISEALRQQHLTLRQAHHQHSASHP